MVTKKFLHRKTRFSISPPPYLPRFQALSGDLGERNHLVGKALRVCLAAREHEESERRGPATNAWDVHRGTHDDPRSSERKISNFEHGKIQQNSFWKNNYQTNKNCLESTRGTWRGGGIRDRELLQNWRKWEKMRIKPHNNERWSITISKLPGCNHLTNRPQLSDWSQKLSLASLILPIFTFLCRFSINFFDLFSRFSRQKRNENKH